MRQLNRGHGAIAVFVLCGICASAQIPAAKSTPSSQQAVTKPAPRMPDGKPDLSGFWQGPLMRNFFESVGGKPPLTPEGQKAYDFNMKESTNPEGLCLFAGVPRASISGVPFEIIQNHNRVAFLYELMSTWRTIPVDGRAHPKRVDPSYFGNGIGSWDGDTFVIDSIGFKDRLSWIDDDGHPHSDQMHVVERWKRLDADHLDHTVRVEDPKFYTQPWTFHRVFTAMPQGQEIMEYACDENNIDRDSGRLGYGPHNPANYPGVR